MQDHTMTGKSRVCNSSKQNLSNFNNAHTQCLDIFRYTGTVGKLSKLAVSESLYRS